MAPNSLSPAFLKIKYTANNHPHVMTMGILPDDIDVPAEDMTVTTKFGTPFSLASWLTEEFASKWEAFFKGTDSLDEAEVWSQPTPSDDPLFKGVIAIAAVGSSAGTTQPFSQAVLTLRTTAGGIAKMYLMEGTFTVNTHDPRPFSSAAVSDLATLLTGPSSILYARDNSFPILGLTWNTKTNDALRKKYLLNA
jgi:hypothetical protein